MYDEQSACYMTAAFEHINWYDIICQHAGRLQGQRTGTSFDQGLMCWGIAHYIRIYQGDFVLLPEGTYDPRRGAYAYALHYGGRFFTYVNLDRRVSDHG